MNAIAVRFAQHGRTFRPNAMHTHGADASVCSLVLCIDVDDSDTDAN